MAQSMWEVSGIHKGTAVVIVVSYRRCVDAEEFFDCAG
jgi:hypothetical protein